MKNKTEKSINQFIFNFIGKDITKYNNEIISFMIDGIGFNLQANEIEKSIEITAEIGIPKDIKKASEEILMIQPYIELPAQSMICMNEEDNNFHYRIWTPIDINSEQAAENFGHLLHLIAENTNSLRQDLKAREAK